MIFADVITFTPQAQAPRLARDGVVLRPHVLADFDAFWAFHQSPRAQYVGKPTTIDFQWYGLCSEIASWPLRGMGGWGIEASGDIAGQICISQPPYFPEVELGWILFDGFEGRGIAHKAATLALDWFWGETDHPSLVSYIDPQNARSIALAKRLGAVRDPDAQLPEDETPDETVVYRHRRLQ